MSRIHYGESQQNLKSVSLGGSVLSQRQRRLRMVKESSAKMSRLPGPNIFSSSSPGYKAMARSDSGRMPREEQVQEIIELKKALAKTRQDLQKTRTRRGS